MSLFGGRSGDFIRRAWSCSGSEQNEVAPNGNLFCRRLPLYYLLIALPIVIANAYILGPFQTPDEFNHFFRIVQLSHGDIIGDSDGKQRAGGYIDSSLSGIRSLFGDVPFQPEHKVTAESVKGLRGLFWTWPDKAYLDFPNTVIYPPYFYAPAVMAAKFSQVLGTSILDALILMRLAQGFTSILIAYFALRLAHFGRLTLFALLVVPMTLNLSSSASQDGLMISSLALVFALLTQTKLTVCAKFVVAVVLGATVGAKLAYFPLFLLFALPAFSTEPGADLRTQRLTWIAVALLFTIPWLVFGYIPTKIPFLKDQGIAPKEQLMFLLHNPDFILQLASKTIQSEFQHYAREFVGVLGWLDTKFSANTYRFYGLLLAVFAAFDILIGGNKLVYGSRIMVLLTILLSVGAVFIALYLGWTPLKADVVNGPQGRHFIPLAVLLPLVFVPQRASLVAGPRWAYRLAELLPVLGAYGIWVVPRALMARYWG